MNNHSKLQFLCRLLGVGALASAPVAFGADQSSTASVEAQFKAMDRNGDRKLNPEEHAAGARQMFVAMDGDGDGSVTAAEMDAAHEKVTGNKAKSSDMSAAEKIKVIDTNGDGVLTADEHAAGAEAMFTKMDTNSDRFLTPDELAAGHAKLIRKSGD